MVILVEKHQGREILCPLKLTQAADLELLEIIVGEISCS